MKRNTKKKQYSKRYKRSKKIKTRGKKNNRRVKKSYKKRKARGKTIRMRKAGMDPQDIVAFGLTLGGFGTTILPSLYDIFVGGISSFEDTSTDCPLCLEEFDERGVEDTERVILNKCHHAFHKSCIKESMRHTTICPICRADIGQEDYTKFGLNDSIWTKAANYSRWLFRAIQYVATPSFITAYKLYKQGLVKLGEHGNTILEELDGEGDPILVIPDAVPLFDLKKGSELKYLIQNKIRKPGRRIEPKPCETRVTEISHLPAYQVHDTDIRDHKLFILIINLENGHVITITYIPPGHEILDLGHQQEGWEYKISIPEPDSGMSQHYSIHGIVKIK
jgi:hypothetical protein